MSANAGVIYHNLTYNSNILIHLLTSIVGLLLMLIIFIFLNELPLKLAITLYLIGGLILSYSTYRIIAFATSAICDNRENNPIDKKKRYGTFSFVENGESKSGDIVA
jgi:hypothetical protein